MWTKKKDFQSEMIFWWMITSPALSSWNLFCKVKSLQSPGHLGYREAMEGVSLPCNNFFLHSSYLLFLLGFPLQMYWYVLLKR